MKKYAILAAALLLASCSMGASKPANILTGSTTQTQSGGIEVKTTTPTSTGTTSETVGLANPASKNCTDQWGMLEAKTQPNGGQYNVCVFKENRQCEEWAMMRGDCKKGGRNISIYKTEADVFCAVTGGVVHLSKNPVECELPGKLGRCSTDDYYNKGNECVAKTAETTPSK